MLTITLLLIVFFMIEGISKVAFALTIRPFPQWGWVLASGLVGILLALILWANLPGNGRVADRASARHQPNQLRRSNRLPRMAGAEDLISGQRENARILPPRLTPSRKLASYYSGRVIRRVTGF